jgi:hypothetical protein
METKMSSISMIKSTVYQYVLYCNQSGKYPTKTEIMKHMNSVIETSPYMFGNSSEVSTKGSMRSMLSDFGKKQNPRIEGVLFHDVNGIQRFFVDPMTVIQKQIENKFSDVFEVDKNTAHSDSQYMICDIFSKKGYELYVPKNDRTRKTSFGKTIEESFSNKMVDLNDPKGKWVDVVVFKDGAPAILFEVEESTNLNGLDRMLNYKTNNDLKKIKTYVVSSIKSYKKKFEKEIKFDFYSDLECKFIEMSTLQQIFSEKENSKLIKETFGI